MIILQSHFPSYNYQQDKSAYYDCWITLQTTLKIAASNLYYKITLVWLDSSLSVVSGRPDRSNQFTGCRGDPAKVDSSILVIPVTHIDKKCC